MLAASLAPMVLVGGWLVADTMQPSSYSPVRQSISVLAGRGGTERWIMTGALLGVGCCYLTMAAGLTALCRAARLALVLAGVAAFGIAACPQPVHGANTAHLTWTAIGEIVIAVWPALVRTGARPGSLGLSAAARLGETAVLLGLAAWLVAETAGGSQLGLAERLSSAVQITCPLIVAVGLRQPRRPRRTHGRQPARRSAAADR